LGRNARRIVIHHELSVQVERFWLGGFRSLGFRFLALTPAFGSAFRVAFRAA
jgi:hypothetical protein